MWPFGSKKKILCASCKRELTLMKMKDLRRPAAAESYQCSDCGKIFCFQCLVKREVRDRGGSSEILLTCPHCKSSIIRYALERPLPLDPEAVVRQKAKQLESAHGKLVEVRCIANDHIEVVYKDGVVLDARLGGEKPLFTCGYAGQGPKQFHAFLEESGYKIDIEKIYDRHPPYKLKFKI